MRKLAKIPRRAMSTIAAAALALAAGAVSAQQVKVMLAGDNEVPPVKTAAGGSGTITVAADKSVSGSVTTTGVAGTMAHIHEAAAGKNGGVIIPLKQQGDQWVVPEGAKLTDTQFEAFKAGNLYVNVHSAANPGGEVRAQIKP